MVKGHVEEKLKNECIFCWGCELPSGDESWRKVTRRTAMWNDMEWLCLPELLRVILSVLPLGKGPEWWLSTLIDSSTAFTIVILLYFWSKSDAMTQNVLILICILVATPNNKFYCYYYCHPTHAAPCLFKSPMVVQRNWNSDAKQMVGND